MKTSDKAHLQMALGKIFDAILGDFLCSLKAMFSMCPLVSFFPLPQVIWQILGPNSNEVLPSVNTDIGEPVNGTFSFRDGEGGCTQHWVKILPHGEVEVTEKFICHAQFSPERWVLIPEPDRSHSRYVLVLLSTESDDILNAKDKTVNTAMYHFSNGVQCVRSLDWEVWRPQWHSAVHRTGPERAHLQWAFWQRRTAQNIPPYYTQRGRHGQHHGRKTTLI